MIALAVTFKWVVKCLDIKSAFLQGKEIQRVLHLKPPVEANTDKLWLLRKTIYGLNDASRKWYVKMLETLLSLGMLVCKYDEALFYWKSADGLEGMLAIHVDDVFVAGTGLFFNVVVEKLKTIFQISLEVDQRFNFLGLEIEQFPDRIVLHQNDYIRRLECQTPYTVSRAKDSELSPGEYD